MIIRSDNTFLKRSLPVPALLLFVFLAALLFADSAAFSGDEVGAQAAFEQYYNRLNEVLVSATHSPAGQGEEPLNDLIREVLYIDRLAPQILQKEWPKLNQDEREQFKGALVTTIGIDLRKRVVKRDGIRQLPRISFESKELKERFAKFTYSFSGSKGKETVTVFMLDDGRGIWKVSNMRIERETLLRRYYKKCDNLVGKYSFAYLIGELMGRGYIILEDFESSEVGKLPKNWTWKSKDNAKNKPYEIVLENGNKHLAAKDNGESVIIGKNIKWNLKKYPYVSFRWRASRIPAGGDERYGKTNDSAAGIYFIYKKKFGLIPESVKFVWSTTLPVGSAARRSGTGRPWVVVAESGAEGLGEWRTYSFNLYEAYKKTFGSEPPDRPIGIGLLSDANSTKSSAYADYDDILALKQADADSGVKQHLKAE